MSLPKTCQQLIDYFHDYKDMISYNLVRNDEDLQSLAESCSKYHSSFFVCNDSLCHVIVVKRKNDRYCRDFYYILEGLFYFDKLLKLLGREKINWAQEGF